jgi:hypothetical protein
VESELRLIKAEAEGKLLQEEILYRYQHPLRHQPSIGNPPNQFFGLSNIGVISKFLSSKVAPLYASAPK